MSSILPAPMLSREKRAIMAFSDGCGAQNSRTKFRTLKNCSDVRS
jgi:hypothetical protein